MSQENEALFRLIGSKERQFITGLVKAVRRCFGREDITAEQIHHLAVLLFALERLPLATPRVTVDLVLSYQRDDGSSSQAIHIDETSLSLSSGGYVQTPDVGGDSYSEEVLMVETGGFREVKRSQLVDWLEEFESRLVDAEIQISLDDADVDWSDEPDESAWERAAKQHAEPEEPEDE